MSLAGSESLLRTEFFQAVRLLQRHGVAYPRIGYANLPKDEPVRFGQTPSLTFPTALIDAVETPAEGGPTRVKLAYHGLLGVNGPLPTNYTEYVYERLHNHRDETMVEFLNLFHHRMMSFLARAWADNNIAVDMDRPQESHYRRFVASLVGQGQDSLMDRDELPDNGRFYFSGWLSRGTRSSEGLGKILGDFFETKAEIQPFQGRWLTIPPENRSRLAGPRSSGLLGESLILGESVWDGCLSLRVLMGPLSYSQFKKLQPGSTAFKRLCCWVKSYVGETFFWDVAFDVQSRGIPAVQLGDGSQLGYNSWIGKDSPKDELRRVVFESRAA
ncbi:MAG: type VI secretion system baseplate subunit TssG [Nibricoccus sp.]